MSANFSPAADAWLDGAAGAAGPTGTGGYTIAALYRPASQHDGLVDLRSTGADVRYLLQDAFHLFGFNDFSTGDATTTTATWWVGAQTKATGSVPFRHHAWLYDSTGAGTMIHAVSTGSTNRPDGPAIDQIRIGWAAHRGNGDIAVVGLWTSVLSDAQLDTLKSGNLVAWAALAPAELITFENWNGTTGWSTRIGSSSLSAITGTVGVGANPPGFNFSLSSTVALTPASFAFSAVPVTATPGPVTVALSPAAFAFSARAVTAAPAGPVTVALTPASLTFAAVPLGLAGTAGQDIDWCDVRLTQNWGAALRGANWDARLMTNWTAELAEGCN